MEISYLSNYQKITVTATEHVICFKNMLFYKLKWNKCNFHNIFTRSVLFIMKRLSVPLSR